MGMNKVYNRSTLSNMGIFELREYARSVGVDSPTMYKKDVLIDKIAAVLEGEIAPKPRSNRGRPPKPLITKPLSDSSYINTPVMPVGKTSAILNDSASNDYDDFEEREGILEVIIIIGCRII